MQSRNKLQATALVISLAEILLYDDNCVVGSGVGVGVGVGSSATAADSDAADAGAEDAAVAINAE